MRRFLLAWGALALACGSSSDLEGLSPGPSTVGGGGQTGGRAAAPGTGGRAAVGGWGMVASGGVATACALGNACWPANSYCMNGNVACQCINGTWSSCWLAATGGAPPTGGRSAWSGGRVAYTGGSYSGGRASGGAATIPVCEPVTTLPTMGTACSTAGQSQCLPNGSRCLCERGIWYCNTSCGATPPTADSACTRGAACTYASGDRCACINLRWMCISSSGCPANVPTTGQDCTGSTGVACDYPNTNPSLHFACACMNPSEAGTLSSWTCIQSGPCPATQPSYSPTAVCPAAAICSYGNIRCGCLASTPWICL
jgi:hypothetical protein